MKKIHLLAGSIIGLCLIVGSSAQAQATPPSCPTSGGNVGAEGCANGAKAEDCYNYYIQPVSPGPYYLCEHNPRSTHTCVMSNTKCTV